MEKNYKHLAKMIVNLHTNTLCWIEHNCDNSDFEEIHKVLSKTYDDDLHSSDSWLDIIIDNIEAYCDSEYYFSVIEPIVFFGIDSDNENENTSCPTCWREKWSWYIPWVLCESWCFGLDDDEDDEY